MWPGMMLPIRSLGHPQSFLILSLRSHRSTLLLMILCRSAAVADLAGFVGLPVVWCLSPWVWQGEARVAWDAIDSAAPRLCRL